jgi:type VI protein secretion system component Hcp
MAVDAYMCFDPTASKGDGDAVDIEGETMDEAGVTKKAFEIIDFKWGASSVAKTSSEGSSRPSDGPPGSPQPGKLARGNLAARSISVDSFSVSKPFDTASLGLFRGCTTEDCYWSKAQVLFRKVRPDGTPYVYLMFEFTNVRIDKLEWKISASEGDKPDQEDVDFSFEGCNIFYIPQEQTGKKSTIKKTASWTRKTGEGTTGS